jgi:hypothetical protein
MGGEASYYSLSNNQFPEIITVQAYLYTNNQGALPLSFFKERACPALSAGGLGGEVFGLSIDPKVQKFPSASPYNAMANNPVIMIDRDGRAPDVFDALDGLVDDLHDKAAAWASESMRLASNPTAGPWYYPNALQAGDAALQAGLNGIACFLLPTSDDIAVSVVMFSVDPGMGIVDGTGTYLVNRGKALWSKIVFFPEELKDKRMMRELSALTDKEIDMRNGWYTPENVQEYFDTFGSGPPLLYRTDSRSPEEIIAQRGFMPRGSNIDLVKHVNGRLHGSYFVSTACTPQECFFREYVYELRNNGRAINANRFIGEWSIPLEHSMSMTEFVIPGGVELNDILRFRQMGDNGWSPWENMPGQ